MYVISFRSVNTRAACASDQRSGLVPSVPSRGVGAYRFLGWVLETSLSVLQRKEEEAVAEGLEQVRVQAPAMLEVVISIPAILLLIVLAFGCYLLGRNRGRAEAAAAAASQQFAPPAPPPGLPPK